MIVGGSTLVESYPLPPLTIVRVTTPPSNIDVVIIPPDPLPALPIVTFGGVLYPVPASVTVACDIAPLESTCKVPVAVCLVVRERFNVVILLNCLSTSSISSIPVSNLSAPCSYISAVS